MKLRIAVTLLLLLGACGGAAATERAVDRDETIAREVREALVEANTIAKEYGRQHLGHYLEMKQRDLVTGGLTIAAGIDIEVRARHTRACLVARTDELAETHAWAIATISTTTSGPSPNDRCG